MSEPVRELPISNPAIERAINLARRGVITHLTIDGEPVVAIVPESVVDALRAAEDAGEADTAIDESAESIPWSRSRLSLICR
jgi:hypothetical protein